MTQEVNEKYDRLILDLDKADQTYEARKYSFESRKEKDLDSINLMAAHKKRKSKKRIFCEIEEKIDIVY